MLGLIFSKYFIAKRIQEVGMLRKTSRERMHNEIIKFICDSDDTLSFIRIYIILGLLPFRQLIRYTTSV